MEVCIYEVENGANLKYLAVFSMEALLDHRTTLAYLAYLGYPETPLTSALQLTRSRRVERRKGKVTRNVFLCYVCGAAGSGKTSLLKHFVGKPHSTVYESTNKILSVVNSVEVEGAQKYLIVGHLHRSRDAANYFILAPRVRK
jgi:Ras family protein T1